MKRYGIKLQTLVITMVAATTAGAALGCGSTPHTITLASGAHLNVIQESSDFYKDRHNQDKRIFYLGYESAQNFEDPTALRNEMYDVFDFYKSRINNEGYSKLELTPMKRDLGGGWEGRPFYLERRPSGRWIVL
jgi:hypothetical protein